MNNKSKFKNYGLKMADWFIVLVVMALPFMLTFLSIVILTAGFKVRWTIASAVSFFAFGILNALFSQFINLLNVRVKGVLKSFIK